MAQEEQVVMDMVNEEPREVITETSAEIKYRYLPELKPVYDKRKSGTGSGNVGSSEGFGDPREPTTHITIQKASIPGLWPSSFSDYCCIYRVPNRLRRVNPEAYTPQMLLIGPLHHSKKAQALERSKTDSRYLDYMSMERHKKKYLNSIANMYGVQIIEEFKKIIERDEKYIRESYFESTDWIISHEFVEMMLYDSMFILNLFIGLGNQNSNMKGDNIFEQPCLITSILEDLMLLENQLPYVLLERLFELFSSVLEYNELTLRDLTLQAFEMEGKIKKEVKFRHFTDLFRCVRVETLGLTKEEISRTSAKPPKIILNADKLDSAGVYFVNVDEENDLSLMVTFEAGILKMPCFTAEGNTERVLRNLLALEQCHYPLNAYVCNYVAFLDCLIDTEVDVDLLVKKGVVKNWLGYNRSVAEMVNNLCSGLIVFGSHYHDIAEALDKHFETRYHRMVTTSVVTLRRVYFCDLWTGTATIASVVILVLTFIATVASVLQVKQDQCKC